MWNPSPPNDSYPKIQHPEKYQEYSSTASTLHTGCNSVLTSIPLPYRANVRSDYMQSLTLEICITVQRYQILACVQDAAMMD